MSENFQTARTVIRDGARQWFADLRAQHPTERFYAFAFGCHEDFRGASMWANSLEHLAADGIDPDNWDRVWNPGEWACSDESYSTFFDEAWEAIPAVESEDVDVNEAELRSYATCLGATLAALRDLNDEGLWTRGPIPVLVFFSLWDSAEDMWVTAESLRRINSPRAFHDHPLQPINWVGDVFEPRPPGRVRRRDQPGPFKSTFLEMFKDGYPA